MVSKRYASKLWQLMGFLALSVFAQTSFSQTGSTSDEVQGSVVAEADAVLEEASEEDPTAQEPDADIAQVEDEEEEASGRFIPTEQLSQDLGASFPVDI